MAKNARLSASVGSHTEKGTLVTQKMQDAANADAAGIVQIREDNTRAVAEAIPAAIARALEKCGLVAEGYAKAACPVDTGRLRNSITYEVRPGEGEVYVGTNVEYAPYVEDGTRHRDGVRFLRKAAEEHGAEYRRILESELRGA